MSDLATDVLAWIDRVLDPTPCNSEQFLYDAMESQSDHSLPIIYQPFDAGSPMHWRDRGSAFDYLESTRAEGKRVLDFGPGDGWPSLIVAPYVAEVVGVEGSHRRVQVCQENAARLGISNARFLYVEPGTRLPFEDESFDAAIAASSVEQSPDPKATLRELVRVLRPGGRLRMSYESLNTYRGDQERGAWLWPIDEHRCRLFIIDRDLEGERARQYGITFSMSGPALIDALAPGASELSFEAITISSLEKVRSSVTEAGVCTTVHPSGRTLLAWLHEIGFHELQPTHSGATFAGRLFAELQAAERPTDIGGIDALLRPLVRIIVGMSAPVQTDPMITAVKRVPQRSEQATMDLHLAIAQSCCGTACLVHLFDSGKPIDAHCSEPMIEHGIVVRPGQLVAVDQAAQPPQVVYRWPTIETERRPDGAILLEEGKPVDPVRLRAEYWPQIRAMYDRFERANQSDPKQVVCEGYDRVAERYLEWVNKERSETRMRYTALLLGQLPPGAAVLDLGCGAGGPTTQALAERFHLTGADISARSIALARQNVPGAHFIQADMTELDLAPSSLDGVAAFYSLIHVPRQEIPCLLAKIASWLRPGGLLVATMGTQADTGSYEKDFLGAPMYWSTFDGPTNERLVQQAGLQIIQAQEEQEQEHGEPVTFLWIVARKPARI